MYDMRGLPNTNANTIPTYQPLGVMPSQSSVNGTALHVKGVLVDSIKDILVESGKDLEGADVLANPKVRKWATQSSKPICIGRELPRRPRPNASPRPDQRRARPALQPRREEQRRVPAPSTC